MISLCCGLGVVGRKKVIEKAPRPQAVISLDAAAFHLDPVASLPHQHLQAAHSIRFAYLHRCLEQSNFFNTSKSRPPLAELVAKLEPAFSTLRRTIGSSLIALQASPGSSRVNINQIRQAPSPSLAGIRSQ